MVAEKLWIHGLSGRMGKEIAALVALPKSGFSLIGGSSYEDGPKVLNHLNAGMEQARLLVDFSSPAGTQTLIEALKHSVWQEKAILIGTTGLSREQREALEAKVQSNRLAVLMAPNTSLGINVLLQASLKIAASLRSKDFDIEIIETHHRHKADAPSGTAKLMGAALAAQEQLSLVQNRLARRSSDEIGLVAMRGGSSFGQHQIHFLGSEEELVLSHRALSREVFARGALRLGSWLLRQKPGFYGLKDVDFSVF